MKNTKMVQPDYIFQCEKCNHKVYVDKKRIDKMLSLDCPECGEEADNNWILEGEGCFERRKN